MISWNNCFSFERFGISGGKDSVRTEFERDWDRIIFSSAFRRLQNKTQVFPLPEEVFVHNRLTHSLEVSSVGRSLGKIVGKALSELTEVSGDKDARNFYKNNLKNVVAAACLAHDLGNPAFGHSGEDAISQYFKDRNKDKTFKNQFSKKEWQDLIAFEGNSNAIRVLTKQFYGRLPGGFRLTYSTLGTIIKYPCESLAGFKKGDEFKHRSKYGFFQIDKEIFLDIATKLNMVKENDGDLIVYKRHPFVYLVEAADDICYNIIDFEDAHRLKIFSTEFVSKMFLNLIKLNKSENIKDVINTAKDLEKDSNEKIAYLRAKAINFLAVRCAEVFLNNKKEILQGNFQGDLISNIPEAKKVIQDIKEISYEKIYNYQSVVKIELAGFRIMSGLIEDFVNAALTPKEYREKKENKILQLLPDQYKFNSDDTPYEKVMSIIDFVSGMSDLFALKLYRNIRGISIPLI